MQSCYDGCMIDNAVIDSLRRKFKRLRPELDERGHRCWAASEALELGHGGIKAVAQATGLGERTIRRGCAEVRQGWPTVSSTGRRSRRPGGGRKSLPTTAPEVVAALEALVE